MNKENGEEAIVFAEISSFWLVSSGFEKENGEGEASDEAGALGAGAVNALVGAGITGTEELLAAVPPEKIEENVFGLRADGTGVGFTVVPVEKIEEKGLGEGVDETVGLLAAGAAENIEAKGFVGTDVCGGFEGCWKGG